MLQVCGHIMHVVVLVVLLVAPHREEPLLDGNALEP